MLELENLAREALDFVKAHGHWAPYIAFGLAFGESLAVISLFFPATFVLMGLGPVIAAGDITFLPVWAAATAGASLGDALSYWVARHYKDGVRQIWPLRRHPEMMERGERMFLRYGSLGVFVGRFFGPLRAVVPLIAGMFAMPHFQFQMVNVTSAMTWSFLLLAPGTAAMRMLGW